MPVLRSGALEPFDPVIPDQIERVEHLHPREAFHGRDCEPLPHVRRQVLDWAKARNAARRLPSRRRIHLDRTDSPQLAAPTPTPSRILLHREQVELLRRAIQVVPPRYREVLRFIHEESPTLEELMEFTGKSREAVRKFVERALGHLESALAGIIKGE